MANIIDISKKLQAVKPKLQLGKDEIYEVNDDKNIILQAQQLSQKENSVGFTELEETIRLLLGEDQTKRLVELHPGILDSVTQLTVLFTAIMASINGLSYEEMESSIRFQTKSIK